MITKSYLQNYRAFAIIILASIAPFITQACFNDPDYTFYYAGRDRNCQNIRIDNFRREQLCPIPEVNESCPQTCGRCCVDDPDYQFRLKNKKLGKRGCDWISNANRRKNYCRKWSKGRMIRDACPFACDFCQSAILVRNPTPAPTREDPFSPTRSPSSTVTDSPTKAPTRNPTRTPTKPPTEMPTKSPTKSPTASPSKPPTDSPTKNPTKNPTPSPSKPPTESPTKSPTKNPTASPTKSPTASPTMSSPSPTFECINDLDYHVKNYPIKTCAWIGENEGRRTRNCVDRETFNACPQICGVCCKDEPDYTFTTYEGTTKKCGWVKEQEIRQRRYCEVPRDDGRKLKQACPETCGYCFDYVTVAPSRSPRN